MTARSADFESAASTDSANRAYTFGNITTCIRPWDIKCLGFFRLQKCPPRSNAAGIGRLEGYRELGLVDRAELLHKLLGASHDGVATGLEDLTRVEALALEVLAGLDVLTGGLSEDKLEIGVDVDLGDTQGDGLLDLILGDAGATVQNEGQVAGLGLDLAQQAPLTRVLRSKFDNLNVKMLLFEVLSTSKLLWVSFSFYQHDCVLVTSPHL